MSVNVSFEKQSEKRKESSFNQTKMKSDEKEEIMKCIHHFGYLSETPKNAPIPEECFMCSRAVDCIISLQD